ncbi:MAG TPA: hypothetical protein VEI02_09125, partial [Planctomycetota bacterium]|nr:hypothetical protein [Planctomycetota bacterium]
MRRRDCGWFAAALTACVVAQAPETVGASRPAASSSESRPWPADLRVPARSLAREGKTWSWPRPADFEAAERAAATRPTSTWIVAETPPFEVGRAAVRFAAIPV